jgi:hypothetical protein
MRPVPHPDLITAPYWKSVEEGVFALPRCEACGRHHFYPRGNCPYCGSARIAWAPASGRGEVYSFSVVHRGPSPAFKEEVPYVVAIVKTEEGPHLFTRIVGIGFEQVRIGMKVKVKIQKFENYSLPVFEPEDA